jgi:transcriptional regulator with XRE-family HTH domain
VVPFDSVERVDASEGIWRDHLKLLVEYIKAQRLQNQLTQGQLARLSDLSDTYMSQLERGLHEPSMSVLRALASSLGIRPDQLMIYAAGLAIDSDNADGPGSGVSTETAIRRDARLTKVQNSALLAVVRSYVDDGGR